MTFKSESPDGMRVRILLSIRSGPLGQVTSKRNEIYGHPRFCTPCSLTVCLACLNLSGVVVGIISPRHDESRA